MRNCNMSVQQPGQTCCNGDFQGRLNEFPIAMAYVPWQKFDHIYDLDHAFMSGTIFAELDKPFLGRRAVCK